MCEVGAKRGWLRMRRENKYGARGKEGCEEWGEGGGGGVEKGLTSLSSAISERQGLLDSSRTKERS